MFYFYKARTIPWQSGNATVNIPLDFLPSLGRRRGRLMIERIHILAVMNVTTGGGVSIVQGEDFYTFLKSIRVYDAEGDRRLITGTESWLKMMEENGDAIPSQPTTHAASTTQDDYIEYIINFSQPFKALRRNDYVMPVDDLLNGGGIELTLPVATDIASTGGTVTINSGNYYITVVCSEAHDLQYPVRDVVRGYSFASNTEFYVPVNNKLVRSVIAYKLSSLQLSAWVTHSNNYLVTCEPYGLSGIQAVQMRRAYLTEYGHSTFDPVYGSKALHVVFPNFRDKIPLQKRIGGNLLIRFDSGAAGTFSFLTHYLAPKSRAMTEASAARAGLPVNAMVATAGKGSDRRPDAWGDMSKYMPAKQR